MKKLLKITAWMAGVLLVLVVLSGAVVWFGPGLYTWMVQPEHAFGDQPLPAAPDYSDLRYWAAWPGQGSPAERLPPDVERIDERTRPADVFFLHPTTFGGPSGWVGPVDDAAVNSGTDRGTISIQASVFNACCRIYAPRFRQANLVAYSDKEGSTFSQVMAVAHGDVSEAFHHFLNTIGDQRPFILASHSQGTFHLARLLQSAVDGTPLVDRLVAIYAIGHSLTRGLVDQGLADIPLCGSADQVGCLISWDAHEGDKSPSGWGEGEGDITWNGQSYAGFGKQQKLCVNPITWRVDDVVSNKSDHLGAITWAEGSGHRAGEPLQKLIAGTVTAKCEQGEYSNWLWVNGDRDPKLKASFPGSLFVRNLHGVDYSLFWANIRENAQQRTQAWLELPGNAATLNR